MNALYTQSLWYSLFICAYVPISKTNESLVAGNLYGWCEYIFLRIVIERIAIYLSDAELVGLPYRLDDFWKASMTNLIQSAVMKNSIRIWFLSVKYWIFIKSDDGDIKSFNHYIWGAAYKKGLSRIRNQILDSGNSFYCPDFWSN